MNFSKIKNAHRGFTLMEFTLVFGLIILLALFTLIVIDPARRIGNARNSIRNSDAQNIQKAINAYALDNDALPTAITGLTNGVNYMIAAAGDNSGSTVSCAAVGNIAKVDISNGTSALFNYLTTIPIDPEQTAPYTNGSGYYFRKQGNVIVDVKPCNVYTYVAPTGPLSISGIAFNGSATAFRASTVLGNIYIAKLSATNFVNSYNLPGDPFTSEAIVATVSGSSVSFGASVYTSNNSTTIYPFAIPFSSSKIGVNFSQDSSAGNTVIGTVAGDAITFDTANEASFNPANTGVIGSDIIDSTHFVVAYADAGNSNYGKAVIGSISGTTPSFGSEYAFNAANSSGGVKVSVLDSTHFVAIWRNGPSSPSCGTTACGKAIIGTISGDTISYGTAVDFNPASTSQIDVQALSSSSFIVVYQDAADSGLGKAIIGTVAGDAITFGNEYTYNSTGTFYSQVDKIDANNAIVVYTDNDTTDLITKVAKINGTTITYSDPAVVASGDGSQAFDIKVLDTSTFVVSYSDVNSYGFSRVGTITWE